MSQLADALFSRTKQNVLGLLYARPSQSFYTNEILRLTGMGVATVKRELDRMVGAGIINLTKTGNQHHYQANPYCAIYTELASIVRKTAGIADVLEDILKPLWQQIDMAFVYGEHAAGHADRRSDVDLLVISASLHKQHLKQVLQRAEHSLASTVNPTLVNFAAHDHQQLLSRIMRQPKIWIKGMEDDLRKTG